MTMLGRPRRFGLFVSRTAPRCRSGDDRWDGRSWRQTTV